MTNNYYGNRGNGSSLRHYRTKGSRNGYSKDPNYRPVGQQAQGKIINGRYVYDNPTAQNRRLSPQARENGIQSMQKGYKNNWQQQGNYARAGGEAINRAVAGQTRGVRMKINSAQENQAIAGMTAKARRDLSKAGAKNDWQQQAALERWKQQNRNNISANKKKALQKKSLSTHPLDENHYKTAMGTRIDTSHIVADPNNGGTRYGTEIADPRYRVDGSQRIEAANRIAKKKAAARMQAQGAANNWQQRANQDSSFGRHDDWEWRPKKPGINAVTNSTASYSPSAIQQHYTAVKTGTIEGKVDMAKRALNVAKVNAKKNIQKTATKAYDDASKAASSALNYGKTVAKSAMNSATKTAAKAASNVVNKGKATVDSLLKKFKKKKK